MWLFPSCNQQPTSMAGDSCSPLPRKGNEELHREEIELERIRDLKSGN